MATVFSDDSERRHRSPARTQKNDGPGIGELLRAARERHGLTLEQVSRETKIPRRHLEALDTGKLAALPPFYQRAEIRTYARIVNLDPGLVLARLERGPAPSGVPNLSSKPPTLQELTFWRSHRGLIACAVVLTAIVFWRARPWNLSVDVQTGVGQVTDSTKPIVSPPGEKATHPDVAIRRTEFDQNPQSSASTDEAPRVGTERTETRPTTAAHGDVPITTKQSDEQRSAELPTELIVTTQPAGARVTVDGIGWGTTPVTIRYIAPGNKRIRVSKEGYTATERVVAVEEGHKNTADIRLRIKSETD